MLIELYLSYVGSLIHLVVSSCVCVCMCWRIALSPLLCCSLRGSLLVKCYHFMSAIFRFFKEWVVLTELYIAPFLFEFTHTFSRKFMCVCLCPKIVSSP